MLNAQSFHWATLVLLNVYWAADGAWPLVFLQLFLICLGVGIYWPFVRRFLNISNVPQSVSSINEKFNIADLLKYRERIAFGTRHHDY
tara:strand:+ start:262 stop:525 length:264 start_codon:yes stop_codon:yes gene_type:complete